ncbi:MAG TPA: ZIP family metal transporter [Bacillota bacterium]
MDILAATILGLVAGLSGTMLGGLFILYRSGNSLPRQGGLLGFSGGIMAAVVLFDLWPEAWHFGGFFPTLLGSGIGILMVQFFDPMLQLIPWYRRRKFSKLTKVGILLGVGIGVHNFPEGVALGTTFIASSRITEWLGLALLMAIHNIPEGMVMASAFKIGRVGFGKIILALTLVEVPMALGGTAGGLLGKISQWMIAVSLGFAGGAMALLVAKELLPLAKKFAGAFRVGCGFILGALVGIALVSVV